MPSDNAELPDSSQKPKRRKVAESCKSCRGKKTRCDGQRPVCTPCATKGINCEYNDATVPVPTSTLVDIESRLKLVEAQAFGSSQHTLGKQPRYHSTPTALVSDLQSIRPSPGSGAIDNDGSEPSNSPFGDNLTTGYIHDITRIADGRTTGQLIPPVSPLHDENSIYPIEIETDTASMVVPARCVADDLLECYERLVYPLFPVLHMPTFRRFYVSLWEPQRKAGRLSRNLAEEATFHASLNMVFALGYLNNPRAASGYRLQTADTFYRRARKIMPLDAVDSLSLEIIQYLQLSAIYLTSTKYINRCWNTLAVALRVAQALGLHLDAESSSDSQLKREMGRRAWHMCLVLERLASSLFGRKSLFKLDNHVPRPARIDDEYLRQDGVGIQPSDMPSIMEAFVLSTDVFEVIDHAQKINYGSFTQAPNQLLELTEIYQLNEKIDQIERNLPPFLRRDDIISSSSSEREPLTTRQKILRLQADIVKGRIYLMRLVLLRPNVLATARQSFLHPGSPDSQASNSETQTPLVSSLRKELSNICIRAAISVISTFHTNLKSPYRLLGSSAVFVTLSAATVIIAASLVKELGVDLEGEGNIEVITQAFAILDGHMWHVEGARGAKELLQSFLKTVKRENKRRRNNENTVSDNEAGQDVGNEKGGIYDFDFNDPLWSFQWGGSTPLFGIPGPNFEYT